jgi:hypothetical protein
MDGIGVSMVIAITLIPARQETAPGDLSRGFVNRFNRRSPCLTVRNVAVGGLTFAVSSISSGAPFVTPACI